MGAVALLRELKSIRKINASIKARLSFVSVDKTVYFSAEVSFD